MENQETQRATETDNSASVHPFVIWQCRCGWMVEDVCYQQARIDFECPKCHDRKFSEFLRRNLAR